MHCFSMVLVLWCTAPLYQFLCYGALEVVVILLLLLLLCQLFSVPGTILGLPYGTTATRALCCVNCELSNETDMYAHLCDIATFQHPLLFNALDEGIDPLIEGVK